MFELMPILSSAILQNVDHNIALNRLPIAEGASFDSHAEEHNPTCLPNTRVELLKDVSRWIDNPDSKPIFWLNGMAGTGKSTISRTVAWSRSQYGNLGASFFFKRGEADRGNLAKFVPTLARQLASSVPKTAPHIVNAAKADSVIFGKAVREQFDKLILRPMLKMPQHSQRVSPLVIVIDALDECERDDDIRLLINLFSSAQSPQLPLLRIFITSRPELPIRLGFSTIKGTYQHLILHEIPAPTLKHDIQTFLQHELGSIRQNFNLCVEEEQKLPLDWPGEANLQRLVMMAVPLFIFASTICRFIADWRYGNPNKQLQKVLNHMRGSHVSKLDMTYAPVLEQQLIDKSPSERGEIIQEFRLIVGTIVTLASPLAIRGLALILNVPQDTVADRLRMLHSVLNVPSTLDSPVRLLHLSFRDYLIEPKNKEKNQFWVDKELTDRNLAKQCLRTMRDGLRENICDIQIPGTRRSTIDSQQINACLSPALQYACLYWMHHRVAVDSRSYDTEEVYDFLTKHFLHWLEAMSLIGRAMEALAILKSLEEWLQHGQDHSLCDFVADAVRFILANLSVIEEAPLQIYASALVFAPTNSIVRSTFKSKAPIWLSLQPHMDDNWDACLSTLEGHSDLVNSVVFSHDSKLVASASSDDTVRIWNVEMGKCEQVLEGHSNAIKSGVFSHDSKLIASASWDKTVRIWNVSTGNCEQVLRGHSDTITSIIFSHDSKLMVSASSDRTVRIWNVEIGKAGHILEGHSELVESAIFSHDSKLVASVSDDETVRIWSVDTGKCEQVLSGHSGWVKAVVFSHDSKLAASASFDKTVRIWSVKTGKCETILGGHSDWVDSVVFSHNSKLVASASKDKTIRIWAVDTGKCEQVLEGHSGWVKSVVFSHDSKLVVSASWDKTVRIWSVGKGKCEQVLEGHSGFTNPAVFSYDSKLVASASWDKTVRIWRVEIDKSEHIREGYSNAVTSLDFSYDAKLIISASSYETVRIWRMDTGECGKVLEGHGGILSPTVFSHDSKMVASASDDHIVWIWNAETGKCEEVLDGHSGSVNSVAFSHDSKLVASTYWDETVRIWNVETRKCEQVLEGHSSSSKPVVFSHDSTMVALASDDETVQIWNVETGNCEQVLDGSSFDSVVFSYDSTMVASASVGETVPTSRNKTVRIWNAKTGECERVLEGHSDTVGLLVFSHDSTMVASAFLDRTVRIWDLKTGESKRVLEGHSYIINSLVFSHDSTMVASASWDGTVRVWNVESGKCERVIDFDLHISSVSFEPGNAYLVTDIGMVPLGHELTSFAAPPSLPPQCLVSGLRVNDQASWITLNGQDLLWLPVECRNGKWAVFGSSVVIGCTSGRVVILAFCPSDLHQLLE
ncbi:hypothetical protein V3481_010660 [Fusarium oxysporum f. sp. vasinfectum]